MTYQDAYTEGFCKTAEAYGVDPRELMKVATYVKAARGNDKDKGTPWGGATAGGALGSLYGLNHGALLQHGFDGTIIDTFNPKNLPMDTKSYRAGSSLKKLLTKKLGGKRALRKFLSTPLGKTISPALLLAPAVAGTAGGGVLGGLIHKGVKKLNED